MRLPSPGWVAPRAIIDQRLRDCVAEQATLHYGQTVRSIERRSDHWLVGLQPTSQRSEGSTVLRCDAVILATGSATRLAQSLGLAPNADMGTSATIYANGDLEEMSERRRSKSIDFHFGLEDFRGYGWVFPVDDRTVNVGMCSLWGSASAACEVAVVLRCQPGMEAVWIPSYGHGSDVEWLAEHLARCAWRCRLWRRCGPR